MIKKKHDTEADGKLEHVGIAGFDFNNLKVTASVSIITSWDIKRWMELL